MSSNSKTEYNEFIRANLPAEITYDEVRAQYVTINGKRFPTYLQAKWYMDYIKKFGFVGISVYAILSLEPPLVLDFDESYFRTGGTATDLVSAATHTRASSATYVDANGILQTAAINEPRVGHHIWNGSAWVDEGYFHESEARTNLVTYSEDMSDASWAKTSATISSNVTTSPSGTLSADKIIPDNLATNGNISKAVSVSAATYTLSFYAKAEDQSVVSFVSNMSGTFRANIFNLSTGVVTQATDWEAKMIDAGNGWWRCTATAVAASASSYSFQIGNNSTGWTGDGTSGIYVYGAQLEAGSTPSSYIFTAGATVTRAADAMTIPAANLPWPEPVVIGPELVTNGTFDTDTDWTLDATSSISGGVLSTTKTTAGEIASQVISITAGRVYKIEYTVISTNGEVLVPRLSGNSASSAPATSTVGTFTAIVTAVSDLDKFAFNVAGSGLTATIDNVSVREINPLAVSIQMEGTMTYADTDAGIEVEQLIWSAGSTEFIRYSVETSGTRTGQQEFWQRDTVSGQYILSSGTGYYSPGINVPFNIASRHGSTFLNGAVDGTALTATTAPTALPYLENADMRIGSTFNGTIKLFRVWADDLTDEGISEASA